MLFRSQVSHAMKARKRRFLSKVEFQRFFNSVGERDEEMKDNTELVWIMPLTETEQQVKGQA